MHYFGAEEEEPETLQQLSVNSCCTVATLLKDTDIAMRERNWHRDPARRRTSEYCRSADSGRNGSKAAQRTVPLTPDAAAPVSGSAQFGWRIDLGPTEYRLLQHFLRNLERVFSRQQLLEIIWRVLDPSS